MITRVLLISAYFLIDVHAFSSRTFSVHYRPASGPFSLSLSSRTDEETIATTRPQTTEEQILSRYGHDHESWKNGYASCTEEYNPTILDFSDLPDDFPAGTYFRNGHARFESDDGINVFHMFDGDGMVIGMTFYPDKKKVLFRNRFVRTEGYVEDKQKGIMSKPGVFGTKVSGGLWKNLFRTDFKNVANTHVLFCGDKLYALWEAGWPYVLDPLTLENDVDAEPKGHNLNGLLKPGDGFAAHYRCDPTSGNIANFRVTLDVAKGESTITLWEFDKQMNSVRSDNISIILPGAVVSHDFCITENWYVFVIPPASVDQSKALGALLGKAAFSSVVDFDTDTTETTVCLVPRSKHLKEFTADKMKVLEDDRIKSIQVPYHFSFHFANAFEDNEGNVVIDSCLAEEVVFDLGESSNNVPIWETIELDDLYPNKYVRITVNPKDRLLSTRIAPQTMSTREPEFPSIPKELTGKRHRYAYTTGAHKDIEPLPNGRGKAVNGAVLKIDTENPEKNEAYAFLPHEFVGEQVFCAKEGVDVTQPGCEDKGYLITLVENRRDLTTDMVILDVEGEGSLERGPVARIRMPTYIPPGLHGIFVEGLTFDLQ